MDFFAGSGSMADAVMRLNAADGGNRPYILVQIDEPTPEDSAARAAGYGTIAALARARCELAGAAALAGNRHASWAGDVGFRTFRIDSSNMNNVLRTPDDLTQAELDLYAESVKPDRTGLDLLFQVLLEWGLDLTLPISKEVLGGEEVYVVEDNALIGCFSERVTVKLVTAIADRAPLRAVFRDSAFARDADRTNAGQIFAERSPATDLKTV